MSPQLAHVGPSPHPLPKLPVLLKEKTHEPGRSYAKSFVRASWELHRRRNQGLKFLVPKGNLLGGLGYLVGALFHSRCCDAP
jgi:hypothetical protein